MQSGLHDPNQMRKHATHNFLQRCEYLFVVAPQLRVEADESVHEHLIHSSRIVNSNKALVCTKIDVGILKSLSLHRKLTSL